MGRKGNLRVYQFVDALVATGVRELVTSAGMTEQTARDFMTAIAHQMCFQYAKEHIYVPAVMELKLSSRDVAIYNEHATEGPDGVRPYTAARLEQIAAAHDLTLRQCYNIIALARRRDQAMRQPQLPGLEAQAE